MDSKMMHMYLNWLKFYNGSRAAFDYLNSPVQNCLLREDKTFKL